jgi:hypothetical protein
LSVVPREGPTRRLLVALRALALEHLRLGALRPFAFLPPDALDLLLAPAGASEPVRLDLLEQQPSRQEPVHRLRACLLALHGEPTRHVT